MDCTIDDAADTQKELPFKGEMDIAKLEKLLRENPREKVPCVVLTITNNTAGGQPVSMRNIRETAEVCRRYGVPLLLDSARFAENAYFIKTREEGYADKTIKEIVREIYTYADIMTISAKKDGVVNMGGFVAMRSEELYRQAMTFSIMFEGYVTYGGMSGRDMDALAVGLDENTEYEQLDARIRQVKLLGDLLDEYVTFVVFFILNLAPGDPAAGLLGQPHPRDRRGLPQHLRAPRRDHHRLPHHLRSPDPAAFHSGTGQNLNPKMRPPLHRTASAE